MSHAQYMRGNAAMSRDIDEKMKARRKDSVIERLEASRDIARKERDAAIAGAAELQTELERARRALRSSRASLSVERDQWEADRADLKFRLNFACERNKRLSAAIELARKEQP